MYCLQCLTCLYEKKCLCSVRIALEEVIYEQLICTYIVIVFKQYKVGIITRKYFNEILDTLHTVFHQNRASRFV